MKLSELFWFLGVWTVPLGFFFGCLLTSDSDITESAKISIIVVSTIILPIIITWCNCMRLKRGHNRFNFRDALGIDAVDIENTKDFIRATYPPIKKELLAEFPKDLVVGEDKQGNYIYFPISLRNGINISIAGGVGSGKSTLLINILLSEMYQDRICKTAKKSGTTFNWFCVDVKGEIYRKLIRINGEYNASCNSSRVLVIDPSNRCSYGYDPLYRVKKKNVSDTEKIKAIADIAESLIPDVDKGNDYFTVNARKILSGIFLYYCDELEFIDIIQKITRSNIMKLIKEIVENASNEGKNVVVEKLANFAELDGNESLQDVLSTMYQNLDVFSYPDIVYMLKDNPHRISPAILEDGYSCIDLSISESFLATYNQLFRLIVLQVFKHAECDFKETDDRRTMIIIDEFARCKKMPVFDGLATLRSRKTSIIMCYQNVNQLLSIYSEAEVNALINLCSLQIYLSGTSDKKSIDMLSDIVGEFQAETHSYGKSILETKKDLKFSESMRPIISGKSLNSLVPKKEFIAIYFGEYIRARKLEYFNDTKYLKSIYEEISDFNKLHAHD